MEVAWTRGIKAGLKQSNLRSWFGGCKRADEAGKPKAKSQAKAPAKQAADGAVANAPQEQTKTELTAV